MLFNSYLFIFLFLPLAILGWYGLNALKLYRLSNLFLIGMSLWFYGYFHAGYLFIICGSIVFNFLVSRFMQRISKNPRIKKLSLAVGICANIAVIFYFKYFDFFLQNVNAVFGKSFALKNIVLPLGISFFTFQQVSYLVDSYRGETDGYSFDEYALFVCFFPQLIAGPIVLHKEMLPQFRDVKRRSIIPQNFSRGMYIFAVGLFKKVLIADTFAKAVSLGFAAVESLSSIEALLVSFFYTFQLYFDFSGYCDMAAGIGAMFNIELPQNFNSPYKALSITDFWARWHMSLTRFLRDYLYIPLGGNRKGKVRTYLNIIAVFLVSGIWHGANWTFILWGLLHGLLNCINRLFKKQWEKLGKVIRWAVTFLLVNMLWVIFRADNISSALLFLKKMCSMSDFTVRPELYECFHLQEFKLLERMIPVLSYLTSHVTGLCLWLFLSGAFLVTLNCRNSTELEFKPTAAKSLTTAVLVIWSVLSFSGISVFLYFNF